MTRLFLALVLVFAVTLALCVAANSQSRGEKERLMFRTKPAESYPARDAHEGLVVAAQPYQTPDEIKEAFGKNDPNQAGFLPVLLVISNTTGKAVRLDDLKIEFITYDRQKIEPTPASDVALRMRKKVNIRDAGTPKSRLPNLGLGGGDRGVEVLANAFQLRMVVPQATVTGFLYFDVGTARKWVSGSKLFLSGMKWANSGQDLMFYELELDKALGSPKSEVQSSK